MKLLLKQLIITAALLCCSTGVGYGQASMSFEIQEKGGSRDSIRFDVIVENNGPGNFILTSVQFMLAYDTADVHVDQAKTITNLRFETAAWISSSNATYSSVNSADPDTLLYNEHSPDSTKGLTIPKNAPLTLCTLTFFNPGFFWEPQRIFQLIGNTFSAKQSGFTTISDGYFPFDLRNSGWILGIDPHIENPASTSLHPCYPNPVSNAANTQISFFLASAARARLTVANALGQTIARLEDGEFHAGTHSTTWSPQSLPAGVYFIIMETFGTTPQRFARAVAVR